MMSLIDPVMDVRMPGRGRIENLNYPGYVRRRLHHFGVSASQTFEVLLGGNL